MATVTGVTNHWITAQEGFTTTLASTISSGATTVPLNSVSGYTNGDIVAFVIEPTDASKKQVFTGTIDTAGVQVTGVVWTEGTNQTHNAGVTVVDYWTATHQAAMVKGLKVSHDQDGTLKAGAVDVTAVIADAIVTRPKLAATFAQEVKDGWMTGDLPAVSSVTNNGNRSYDITFASTVASLLSPGMRLRTTRTVTAPTQCTSLNGTTQYWSKASPNKMTATDNITVMAWVKMTAYSASTQVIMSRINGTTDGWHMYVLADGRVGLSGARVGDDAVNSYQSLPLNKWVHVAISINSAGTSGLIYIDGVLVPSSYTNNANSGFLAPTADFRIGAGTGGTLFFGGKIAQVAMFDAVISASTIRTYISQGLSGSETNLKSAYSFNNSFTDLNTTTPNDLTANGSAVATNADSPFGQDGSGVTAGTTDYALVMKVSTTTATVQVPEGCTIPTSGGVSAVAYSTTANPYGWVGDKGRWKISSLYRTIVSQSSPVSGTWYNINSAQIVLPTGSMNVSYAYSFNSNRSTTAAIQVKSTLSTANNTESDRDMTATMSITSPDIEGTLTLPHKSFTQTTSTTYYLNAAVAGTATLTILYMTGDRARCEVEAIPAGI